MSWQADATPLLGEPDRPSRALVLLCGLPAAGKTTLSRILLDHIRAWRLPVDPIHVRFDDDTDFGGDEFSPEAWRQARSASEARVARALLYGGEKDGMTRLVIADDNMHYRGMRRRHFRLARDAGAAFAILFVDCSTTECLARNAVRGGRDAVPDRVIERMAASIQPPRPEEFPWERGTIRVQGGAGTSWTEGDFISNLWGHIWTACSAPAFGGPSKGALSAARDAGRRGNESSAMHRLDNLMKMEVGRAIGRVGAGRKGDVGRRLAEARRGALEAARRRMATGENSEEVVAEELAEWAAVCERAASM